MQITALYIHQEDGILDGLIGPFTSTEQLNDHLALQRSREDNSRILSVYAAQDREFIDLVKNGCLLLTPEQDAEGDTEE